MVWCENQVDLFRAAIAVACDYLPFHSTPTYLFGNTPANEESLIGEGLALHRAGRANPIVLCGGGPYMPPNGTTVAYSGGDFWRDRLVARGVPAGNIVFMNSPRPTLSHTGTDAERFVRFAKLRGWRAVTVVACPPHLLRAFAVTVRQVQREYPELLVYSQPGAPLPWDQKGALAQGVVCETLIREGMALEWDRLNRVYNNPYDPANAEEVIAYIAKRDAMAKQLIRG